MTGGGKAHHRHPAGRITCTDGASLSVQASSSHYCTPRSDKGPWTHVEVGFPDPAPGPLWLPYCEDPENPGGTVYAYVPIELVRFYIGAHGGAEYDHPENPSE